MPSSVPLSSVEGDDLEPLASLGGMTNPSPVGGNGCNNVDHPARQSPAVKPLLFLALAAFVLAACTPRGDSASPALVATTSTTSSTTLPAEIVPLPADSGLLVVEAFDGSVLLVDPDDGAAQELHRGAGDGSVVQPTGARGGGAVVWLMDPAAATVGLWVNGETSSFDAPFSPFFFAFSPDGSKIAMLGNDRGEVGLAVLDIESGAVEQIDRGAPYYVDWHPDSAALGAHIGTGFAGTVDLTGLRDAVEGSPGRYQAPEWLDGQRLLTVLAPGEVVAQGGVEQVVLSTDSEGAIASVDVESGRTERLRDIAGHVAFEVSPDASAIAYVEAEDRSSAASIGRLSVLSLQGGEPVEVNGGPVVAFEWSPTGDSLLFLTLDLESGLLAPRVWDGSEVSEFEGYRPTPVFVGQYLPFWDQYSRALTTWSPTGDAFTYASLSAAGGEIWVQPLAGERRKVADGEFASWIGSPEGGADTVVP